MATRLVTLATFPSPVEAALARNILDEAGIRAHAADDATGWAFSGMFGGVKLLVDEADLERAGDLLDAALGEPLEAEEEPPDAENEDTSPSDFAENLADRSPADDNRAWTCGDCGARVGHDERRCWSCGASRSGEANPYYVRPESAIAPPPAAKRETPREPPEHVRDWIDRGWRAACFSAILLPPLFNFYSAWLLLRAASEATDLPPSYNRKFYGAFAINLVVTGLSILIWISVLRGGWVIDLLPLV
jgi:hypothetical protein